MPANTFMDKAINEYMKAKNELEGLKLTKTDDELKLTTAYITMERLRESFPNIESLLPKK